MTDSIENPGSLLEGILKISTAAIADLRKRNEVLEASLAEAKDLLRQVRILQANRKLSGGWYDASVDLTWPERRNQILNTDPTSEQ